MTNLLMSLLEEMSYKEPDLDTAYFDEPIKFSRGHDYSKKYHALSPSLSDTHQPLSIKQKNVFKKYTDNSTPMNKELWDMKLSGKSAKKTTRRTALDMEDLLDKLPKPNQDMVVYSGVNDEHFPKTKDGIVHIPSFVSTSLHPAIASYHSESHILRIHIKKGSRNGGFIAPFSNYKNEEEYLLKPNQVYKIHPNPTIVTNHVGRKLHIWDAEILSGSGDDVFHQTPVHPEVQSYRDTNKKMVKGL